MVNRLIELISREAVVFENFLALLERQKQMLLAGDVEGLNEVTELQREALVEAQLLHKKRESLVETLRDSYDLTGDFNVSMLLDLVDQSQAERLTQLRELIFDLNGKINDVRNTNAMLLNQSRQFIAKTMKMLSRINHPKNTYTRAGRAGETGSSVVVNRRA